MSNQSNLKRSCDIWVRCDIIEEDKKNCLYIMEVKCSISMIQVYKMLIELLVGGKYEKISLCSNRKR